MLILLTNDDGIHAPGIQAMWKELTKLGEVHVVAPETVQSATGHGITIETPLLTRKIQLDTGYHGTAVDGRPADCVKLAVSQILPKAPDLVVSGVNSGANVGINVVYSGTVAAAIEAAFLGLPSVATSLYLRRDVETSYEWAAELTRRTIEGLLERGLRPGQVASINIPAVGPGVEPAGVRFVRQCTRAWIDTYERRTVPRSDREYYWNNSIFTLGEAEEDTDVAALREGYITVTPLMFDLTDHLLLKKWNA